MTQLPNAEERIETAAGAGKWMLRVGSHVPDNVYSADGILLLRAGGVISTHSQLVRLIQPDVLFGKENAAAARLAAMNRRISRARVAKSSMEPEERQARIETATALKAEVVGDVTSVFGRIEDGGMVDVTAARGAVSKLMGEMFRDDFALASLVQLKDVDGYTFTHSVNTSILSMYLAMTADCPMEVTELGLGALLHDIGKLGTPVSILRKVGPLDETEMGVIRQHPERGVELLAQSGCRSEVTQHCVLDHHEKMSGSGYPCGKVGKQISPYARIVCLADIYDALTTDRPYRKALSPRDALSIMAKEMESELDQWWLKVLEAAVCRFVEEGDAPNTDQPVATPVADKPLDEIARPTVLATTGVLSLDVRC